MRARVPQISQNGPQGVFSTEGRVELLESTLIAVHGISSASRVSTTGARGVLRDSMFGNQPSRKYLRRTSYLRAP